MKISLGTWSFSFGPYADNPVPWETTVERAAKAGYDGVEVCGFWPHVTLEDYASKQARRQVVQQLQDLNLGVSGYSADLTTVNPTAGENKTKYLDLFRRNVDFCVDIGSPMIRVDTISAPGSLTDREYESAFGHLAEVWHEAADAAQQAHVRMGWEFEPGFIINKPSELVALHDSVKHSNFKVIFDTAHAYMASVVGARQQGKKETLKGGVPELLKLLDGRVGHVHIIDSDGTLYSDETSTHRPFGEGKIDFKSLVPRLLKVPDIEWWCIDLCFWPRSWELVESSLEYVRRMLGQDSRVSVTSER